MNGFKLFAMAVAVIVGIPVAAAVASNRFAPAPVMDESTAVCELSANERGLRPARPDKPTSNLVPARSGPGAMSRV